MEADLVARLRFSNVMVRFASMADQGRAIQALHMLSDDFLIEAQAGMMPKGALANVLMMRQVSEYSTRHHVAEPIISSFSDERICGVAPIVSYKLEDGKLTIGVVEFTAEIVPGTYRDGTKGWKIDRLKMAPYASMVQHPDTVGAVA